MIRNLGSGLNQKKRGSRMTWEGKGLCVAHVYVWNKKKGKEMSRRHSVFLLFGIRFSPSTTGSHAARSKSVWKKVKRPASTYVVRVVRTRATIRP